MSRYKNRAQRPGCKSNSIAANKLTKKSAFPNMRDYAFIIIYYLCCRHFVICFILFLFNVILSGTILISLLKTQFLLKTGEKDRFFRNFDIILIKNRALYRFSYGIVQLFDAGDCY